MVKATNVSQKACSTLIKKGGKVLSEKEVNECLAHGGMVLPSGEMTMPMSEEREIQILFHPKRKNMEEQYVGVIKKIRNGESCSADDYLFLIKEGNINLRIVYGVYLSMCQKNDITKVITWRTFYMQCNGYRTLKPNTMAAVSEYILMREGYNATGK